MADILQRAMTHGRFDTVFTEVTHKESVNQSSKSQMRLFYLSSIEDRSFDTAGLVKLLRRNLGHYFFSRGEISQFEKDDDVSSIGLDAASELRKLDYSRIFEEIMICYLLEDRMNAPKLMSRPEILSASGKYEGVSDSVHFLLLEETGEVVKFQMIFGAAKVHEYIDEALDDVFRKIETINTAKLDEKILVESTLFSKKFSPETEEYLAKLLTPTKAGSNKRTIGDNAYGIFIGYSLGLTTENRSSDQFFSVIDKKMERDIQHFAPLIQQRIASSGLGHNPFYIFFIPLNDAEVEKNTIIEAALR